MRTAYRESALADYIERRDYGEIIHYQEIENITGCKRKTSPYYNAIAKARKILERNGKAIVRIEGGDYRILYPGDYTGEYANKVKQAKNRIVRGKRILDGAPTQDMSESELQDYRRVNDFSVRITALMSGCVVEVKRLTGHKHPFETAVEIGDKGAK